MKNPLVKKATYITLLTLIIVVGVSFTGFATSNIVYADNLGDRLQDFQNASTEDDFLTSVVEVSMILAGMALIGLSIYAGFVMLTSSGNPEKINEAREIITNAVLGFALIALSVGILLIIAEILQLPGL